MPLHPPARIGQSVDDIDTPALVIDLDAFERNIATMAALIPDGIRLRAHAKTHKSAKIAALQMAAGAIGVCCQKVSEASQLVEAGVTNVMVSNQVVGQHKLSRLAELAGKATVSVCVDDAENITALSAAVASAGTTLQVLVEIDVGSHRCGVAPGEPAVALARLIADSDALEFAGLQAYHGSAQHFRTDAERGSAIEYAVADVEKTRRLLTQAGLDCPIVAGAGTGTYSHEIASGVYNELQAGSYVFMDADYARNFDGDDEPTSAFEHALFVVSTVMSSTRPGHAVLDAGHKSVAIDSGYPNVWKREGTRYTGASDEHGVLEIDDAHNTPSLGEHIWLVPGHCDPTVNLHNWYVGVRGDKVESIWPVDARGAIY